MSEEIRFHAPINLEMKIMVINHDTRQSGEITIAFPMMRYMTVQQQQDRLKTFAENEIEKHAPGFSIMTKNEAWRHKCIENFGEFMALPGGTEWSVFNKEKDNTPLED